MRKTTIGLVAGLLLTLAVPAIAQTDAPAADQAQSTEFAPETESRHGLEALRRIVLHQLEHRLNRVDRLQQAVRSSEAITPGHAAHLTTDLNESEAGLRTLQGLAGSATSVEQLRSIQNEMIEGHRIFVLRSPQTALVIASDIGVKVADRLGNVADRIEEAADRAEEAGFDVSEVRALVEQGKTLTGEALAVVDPVAESVISLEPSDYPDPAKAVLRSGRDSVHDGRQIFRNAADSLRDAGELLAEIIRSSQG